MDTVETKVSYVADDVALQAAWNEEPESGYMLAKRMGDGSLRVYPVSIRILNTRPPELDYMVARIAPALAGA